MQTILINIIVFQLAVLHGDQTLQKKIYAKIGSEVILTCKISKETSTQSWRKYNTQLTRGSVKNEWFFGHERLEIINGRGFYNLKIYNITEYDFSTYLCETQQGNTITTEETRLINSVIVASTGIPYEEISTDRQRISTESTLSDSSTSETNNSIDRQRTSSQSTLSDSSTPETKGGTGMNDQNSLLNGILATGFAILCLLVCGNCLFNKSRAAIMRRKKRSSDNENEDVLQGIRNDAKNDTKNDTSLSETDSISPHYETINESGMIEMFHPIASQNLSHLTWASSIVQSSQQDNTYLEVVEADNTYLEVVEADNTYLDVIEETNNQKLDPIIKLNEDEDHVSINSSSSRGEINMSTLVFHTENCELDKGDTMNRESPVTIEKNNFEDCKTNVDSTSASSSSSAQSVIERIQESDKKLSENPSQYMSLNLNDMEYLTSYSSPITENKLRANETQNSNVKLPE